MKLNLRITSPNKWATLAKAIGFMVDSEPDEDGATTLIPAKGISIYELPPMVLTPAVMYPLGDIITAEVLWNAGDVITPESTDEWDFVVPAVIADGTEIKVHEVREITGNEGVVLTEATYSTQQHVNINIHSEPALTTFATFYDDAVANNELAQGNKTEVAYLWQGVEVFDPETLNTMANVWF